MRCGENKSECCYAVNTRVICFKFNQHHYTICNNLWIYCAAARVVIRFMMPVGNVITRHCISNNVKIILLEEKISSDI